MVGRASNRGCRCYPSQSQILFPPVVGASAASRQTSRRSVSPFCSHFLPTSGQSIGLGWGYFLKTRRRLRCRARSYRINGIKANYFGRQGIVNPPANQKQSSLDRGVSRSLRGYNPINCPGLVFREKRAPESSLTPR